jgi:uncharacterized protein
MRSAVLAAALLFVHGAVASAAQVPPHTGLVVDQARVLPRDLADQLEQSLRAFQRQYGPQLQVLTISSLEGEPIEAYSIKVVDAWKPGDVKRDDGVLFLIAVQDRQMRIEVGQGLEGVLPDVAAGRIINDVVVPYFKQNRMDAGIVAGLQQIARSVGGELAAPTGMSMGRSSMRGRERIGIPLFPLLLIAFLLFRGIFGRRRRSGGFLTGMILGNVLGSRNRGGGSGWGGSGGGLFGGGGGGGFSGGGSSGRW